MKKMVGLNLYQKLLGVLMLVGLFTSGCTLPVNPCSKAYLINAINSANATPVSIDTIELDAGCLYELDSVEDTTDGENGLPSVTSPIIINGNGATIRRSMSAQKMALRLLHISPGGSLTLNNLTLLDGLGMNPADISLPTLNYGGAIYNNGQLAINDCRLIENRAVLRGGAIFNAPSGTMVINNTTLMGNQAMLTTSPGEHGGGIYNQGTATISNSTFVNNQTTQTGGAIANSGTMFISNSTFSANVTNLLGGSAIVNSGDLEIEYTTIAYNSGGSPSAALLSATDSLEVRNTIIANNISANCSYPVSSAVSEENISDDGSCSGFTITADPQLEPLADNGGPTRTHAFAPSSPAKNAASGSCPASDQRGQPRPHGPACDIGPYEFSGGTIPATDTPIPGDGSISGWTYIDGNDNGIRDASESTDFVSGAILTLAEGACPGGSTLATTESSATDGSYLFPGLPAGTYCLQTSPLLQTLDPESQTVVLGPSQDLMGVNFRFVPSPIPTITPTLTPTATLVPTSTFTPIPPTSTFTPVPPTPTYTPVSFGQIYVHVWLDANANGIQDRGEDDYAGVRVYVGNGACNDRASGHRTALTGSDGTAFFDELSYMTYCVYTEIVPACGGWTIATTPEEVTVVINQGAAFVINIGYAPYVC